MWIHPGWSGIDEWSNNAGPHGRTNSPWWPQMISNRVKEWTTGAMEDSQMYPIYSCNCTVYLCLYICLCYDCFCECTMSFLWIAGNATEYDKIYDFSCVMLSFSHIPTGWFIGTEAVCCDNNTKMNIHLGSDLNQLQSERFGTSWTKSGLVLGHYIMFSHWWWQ